MIPRIGVILLLGVAAVHCQQQQGSEDLDKLIDDVFGGDPNKNANTPSPNPNPGPNTGPNTNIPPPPVDTDQGTTGGVKDTRGTPGEEDGCTCVPYYLCPNGTVLTDGTGLLDIRAKPGLCEEYMDVCCKDPTTQPITPAPKVRRGCGQRNPEGVGFRITGDSNNEAQFGEFPWMTALLRRTILDDGSDIMVYQCGGALIHEKVVLTAAHCVASQNNQDNGELLARVGEWDTQTTNEIFRHQNIKVAKVIVHPGFKRNNLHNDFALLVLEQPVTFADNVDVVCLPTPGVVPLSRECYATGWGKDKFGEKGQYQVILKKIDMPIVPKDHCIALLRKTRLGPFYKLDDSFVCAGGEPGKDTCKGDGGSPLVCPIQGKPGTYEVTGLVAWGIGCGDATPGVYAGVAYAMPWINQELSQLGIRL